MQTLFFRFVYTNFKTAGISKGWRISCPYGTRKVWIRLREIRLFGCRWCGGVKRILKKSSERSCITGGTGGISHSRLPQGLFRVFDVPCRRSDTNKNVFVDVTAFQNVLHYFFRINCEAPRWKPFPVCEGLLHNCRHDRLKTGSRCCHRPAGV